MAYIVMAYIVMAYIVMAYIVMAYIVMAYVVMAYIDPYMVMAIDYGHDRQAYDDGLHGVWPCAMAYVYGLCRHGVCSYGLCRHACMAWPIAVVAVVRTAAS